VARFLALLELFREGVIAFEQATRWASCTCAGPAATPRKSEVSDEFDSTESDTSGLDSAEPGTIALDSTQLETAGHQAAGVDAGGTGDD
jgi:segregation and condensation protein A